MCGCLRSGPVFFRFAAWLFRFNLAAQQKQAGGSQRVLLSLPVLRALIVTRLYIYT